MEFNESVQASRVNTHTLLKTEKFHQGNNMQDPTKSHNKGSKHKVLWIDLLTVVFTIISTIAQLIGLGFQILEYLNQAQPSSMKIVHQETTTNSNKDEPQSQN
jgi:hypothetical protein